MNLSPGQVIQLQDRRVTLFYVSPDHQWALSTCGLVLWTQYVEAWEVIHETLGQVPGVPTYLFDTRLTHANAPFVFWDGPRRAIPFELLPWRNLSQEDAIEALQLLAWTISAIHEEGICLGGLRAEELLWDEDRKIFWIAGFPRAKRCDPLTPELIWRDIKTLAVLLYEHETGEDYPGPHQMVSILKTKALQQQHELTQPGLTQILASAATPHGDISYLHAYELAQDLDQLLTELYRPLHIHVGSRSTMGNYVFRRNNQDACGHVLTQTICGSRPRTYGFFCVADGIGGINDGERASNVAVTEACSAFARAWANFAPETLTTHTTSIARGIAKVVSQTLALHGEFEHNFHRGGTTFTGILLADDRIGLAHVGDSWAALYRDGQLHDLTREHTLAAILESLGEDVSDKSHVSHRTISRFLTTSHELELDRIEGFSSSAQQALEMDDAESLTVQRGDLLILSSDGLFAELDKQAVLSEIVRYEASPQSLCDALIQLALEAVSRDNITVMVLLIG